MKRPILILAALFLMAGYVIEGVGYHRVSKACWDGRHRGSTEGEVYGGGIGFVFDVALWPVYLAADGLSGRDCG